MKKSMRYRMTSLMLILAMLMGTMTGCGSKKQSAFNSGYKYDQELAVVEDNYRNYYEIFVRSFYDTDGDGIGDIKGVTEKLDYIADMGFNGIWLMPIMESTTYHKYDVVDYCSIDSEYGTMEDLDELIEECHKRGIRLIIDFVMNHSSSKHKWFQEACSYLAGLQENQEPDTKECPYVDYYYFDKEKKSSTYYQVPGSEYYYEGSFWSEMPDLNYNSEALKGEFEDIISFWVEKGIDGFRMDATMHFEENNTAFNTSVMNWVYEYACTINPDFYMVSEVWSDHNTIANYYESKTPSMFNFAASGAEGVLEKVARGSKAPSALINSMIEDQETFGAHYDKYIDAPFLTNHDNIRVANNLNNNLTHLKMAAGLLMMMNGSPFVYYGEEIGMKSTGKKDEDKRMPMDWYEASKADKKGMTNPPAGADLGETNSFASVEEQEKDESSLYNYYVRALRLRNENPEIARGKVALVENWGGDKVAAMTKNYDGSTIAILINTDEQEQEMDLASTELEKMSIRGYLTLDQEEITLEQGGIKLPAHSICILK